MARGELNHVFRFIQTARGRGGIRTQAACLKRQQDIQLLTTLVYHLLRGCHLVLSPSCAPQDQVSALPPVTAHGLSTVGSLLPPPRRPGLQGRMVRHAWWPLGSGCGEGWPVPLTMGWNLHLWVKAPCSAPHIVWTAGPSDPGLEAG